MLRVFVADYIHLTVRLDRPHEYLLNPSEIPATSTLTVTFDSHVSTSQLTIISQSELTKIVLFVDSLSAVTTDNVTEVHLHTDLFVPSFMVSLLHCSFFSLTPEGCTTARHAFPRTPRVLPATFPKPSLVLFAFIGKGSCVRHGDRLGTPVYARLQRAPYP